MKQKWRQQQQQQFGDSTEREAGMEEVQESMAKKLDSITYSLDLDNLSRRLLVFPQSGKPAL